METLLLEWGRGAAVGLFVLVPIVYVLWWIYTSIEEEKKRRERFVKAVERLADAAIVRNMIAK
jgi:hypothetical protein